MMLSSLAQACGGQLLGDDRAVRGVTTDSRFDCRERLFVALKGERFDAHDFVDDAVANGAAALMVEREVSSALATVRVKDTHLGLRQIAAWWRAQFVLPVVGVTGSVGKTTVKEMLAAIFAEIGDGLVTQGNLNNEIGVPLTLLRMQPAHQYAIIEMGMNQAGEISRLTDITRPTIVLINNAAAAHLEKLGTVFAVAAAKGEILEGLSADGVAVLNADDRHLPMWTELARARRIVTFGLKSSADVTACVQSDQSRSVLQVSALGVEFSLTLNVSGKHNAANALAAIAVASAANLPPEAMIAGLEKYRPIGGRQVTRSLGRLRLIDDSYNANPASMAAAIEVLAQHRQTTLIVGDMAELGDHSEQAHVQAGEFAAQKGIDRVLACGRFAEQVTAGYGGDQAASFADQAALMKFLSEHPITTGTVLVKGSRSAQMERVIAHLGALNESRSRSASSTEET